MTLYLSIAIARIFFIKKFDIDNQSQYYCLCMEKCHCSGVRFEKIVEIAKQESASFLVVAKQLDVSETCTACKQDMISYCETNLNLLHYY
jgi:cytidine deaminase